MLREPSWRESPQTVSRPQVGRYAQGLSIELSQAGVTLPFVRPDRAVGWAARTNGARPPPPPCRPPRHTGCCLSP